MNKSLFAFALVFSAIAFASEETLPTRRQRKEAEKAAKFALQLEQLKAETEDIRRAEGNSPTQCEANRRAHAILGNRTGK